MSIDNKKKIIKNTIIMALVIICSRFLWGAQGGELIPRDIYISLLWGGMGAAIVVVSFMYVKMKNEICGKDKELKKQLNKIILYEGMVIFGIEFVILLIYQGISEFIFVLWRSVVMYMYYVPGIIICIKLFEYAIGKYDILNKKENVDRKLEDSNTELEEDRKTKSKMMTFIITLSASFICWFFIRCFYANLFPSSENILVMLPVLIIGIASEFIPLICAVLYVMIEKRLNKKVALWTWMLVNIVIGVAFAIYDGIKGYRYGNFVIEIINMGYFRTIVKMVVLIFGTIILIKLIKKFKLLDAM